jgi:hypothetical protein
MHRHVAGQKTQPVIAANTLAIVEMDDLIAIVAVEKPHGTTPSIPDGLKMPAARRRNRHCH